MRTAGLVLDVVDEGFGKGPPADLALGGIGYRGAGDFAAAGLRQRQGAFPRVHARHESVVILVSPIHPPAVKRQEAGKQLDGPFRRSYEYLKHESTVMFSGRPIGRRPGSGTGTTRAVTEGGGR